MKTLFKYILPLLITCTFSSCKTYERDRTLIDVKIISGYTNTGFPDINPNYSVLEIVETGERVSIPIAPQGSIGEVYKIQTHRVR
jgi:hypothetical protein